MTHGWIGISKAPDDPDEKKEWVKHIIRIQVAMWVDGDAKCAHCGKPYKSVDDFIERNPKRGYTEEMSFVDTECWEEYEKKARRKK